MSHRQTFKPGQLAPESGIYEEIDQQGTVVKKAHVDKGAHIPPLMRANDVYRLSTQGGAQQHGGKSRGRIER